MKPKIAEGVWPPNSNYTEKNDWKRISSFIHAAPFVAYKETNIWPSYSKIAFVEFASAPYEQLECVDCPRQHSSVFFCLWMRQAPSDIFQHCLRTHCISLTCDDGKSLIYLPIGLLQWIAEDTHVRGK